VVLAKESAHRPKYQEDCHLHHLEDSAKSLAESGDSPKAEVHQERSDVPDVPEKARYPVANRRQVGHLQVDPAKFPAESGAPDALATRADIPVVDPVE
jgi:hypothetical protein